MSEDFEDFLPYSSVGVLVMRLGKESLIVKTVEPAEIGMKDL